MKYLFFILLSILFATQICSAGNQAIDPHPEDGGMIDVNIIGISLWWTNPKPPESVNVYLIDMNVPRISYIGDVNSYYDPTIEFNYDTTYEWRVDLKYSSPNWVTGDVWEFETPEPESATIFLLGIGSLIFVKRK